MSQMWNIESVDMNWEELKSGERKAAFEKLQSYWRETRDQLERILEAYSGGDMNALLQACGEAQSRVLAENRPTISYQLQCARDFARRLERANDMFQLIVSSPDDYSDSERDNASIREQVLMTVAKNHFLDAMKGESPDV